MRPSAGGGDTAKHPFGQQAQAGVGHFLGMDGYGGEGGAHQSGTGRVVKGDHRKVPRNVQAQMLGRAHGGQGDLLVSTQQGGGTVLRVGEQVGEVGLDGSALHGAGDHLAAQLGAEAR